jgi:hypothetical protein
MLYVHYQRVQAERQAAFGLMRVSGLTLSLFAIKTKNLPKFYLKTMTAELLFRAFFGRGRMSDIDWQKLYETAMLEMNPDKLATCIGAAEQAIARRQLLVDITEVERHKLADARSILKTLSRISLP